MRSFFEEKYRKNVRRDTPAACATSSTVVSSKPFSAKRSTAASQIAFRTTSCLRLFRVAVIAPTLRSLHLLLTLGVENGTECHYTVPKVQLNMRQLLLPVLLFAAAALAPAADTTSIAG